MTGVGSPSRATARSCRAARGRRRACTTATRWRCWHRWREAEMDDLVIADEKFSSRLLLGTGGVPSLEVLERAIVASGTQLVTVALRRVEASTTGSLLEGLDRCGVRLLPPTPASPTPRQP